LFYLSLSILLVVSVSSSSSFALSGSGLDSCLEGEGVNRAKLKFFKIITTTSRVSVRNINESARGHKTNRKRVKR
jgi:hypothetical protein